MAGSSFALLRSVAVGEPAAPADMQDLGYVVAGEIVLFAARIGQFVLPIVFMLGAAASIGRRIKRANPLLDTLAKGCESDQPMQRALSGDGSSNPTALTRRELEMLAGDVYRRQGYKVEETAEGQDGGVDFVLRRENERYFVQCKHWQPRPVDVEVAESVHAGRCEVA